MELLAAQVQGRFLASADPSDCAGRSRYQNFYAPPGPLLTRPMGVNIASIATGES